MPILCGTAWVIEIQAILDGEGNGGELCVVIVTTYQLRTQQHSLRYGSPQSLFFCKSSYVVLWPHLTCSFCGRFVVRQPGPWRRKRRFGASNFQFQANEGVFECPRPPASIPVSGAGSSGHLGCRNGHFRRSFDRHRRPRSCAGNEHFEVILIWIRLYHLLVC